MIYKHRIRFLLLLGILAHTVMAQTDTVTTGSTAYSDEDWRQVLAEYVDEKGLVDYRGLAASREALDRYVEQIERLSPRSHPHLFADRKAELAYYLNAYNALIFHGVLTKGPAVKTVWGATGTGFGFFIGNKVTVGGEKLSLKKLEDDWIRAGFRDPRIHAALNCASRGCPRLPQVPFTAEGLDAELDAAMAEFVGDVRHCRPDPATGTLHLSKIFDWFRKDFTDYERDQGNPFGNVIDYVNRYRAEDAKIPRDYKVKSMKYDKGLNRQL